MWHDSFAVAGEDGAEDNSQNFPIRMHTWDPVGETGNRLWKLISLREL